MEIEGIRIKENEKPDFNFETFLLQNKFPIIIGLLALILLGIGFTVVRSRDTGSAIQIIEEETGDAVSLVVEVAGAVESPGVYELESGSRIEDLLLVAGGVASDADRVWMDKALNRAAKLTDGQKLYIPYSGEQLAPATANNFGSDQSGSSVIGTQTTGLTNINTANLSELDKLPGIGPVYGQRIIDQRPYSDVAELASKDVVPDATYEKIKNLISVY